MSSRTVVFTRRFVLSGLDGAQPAGSYVVETNEELLEGLSISAWRRRSTVIRLHPRPGVTLSATVDPAELDAALMRDGAPAEIRFESRVRRAHRVDMRTFLDTMKSARLSRLGKFALALPTSDGASGSKPGSGRALGSPRLPVILA